LIDRVYERMHQWEMMKNTCIISCKQENT